MHLIRATTLKLTGGTEIRCDKSHPIQSVRCRAIIAPQSRKRASTQNTHCGHRARARASRRGARGSGGRIARHTCGGSGGPGHCRRRGSARTPRPPRPRPAPPRPPAARAPPNDRRARPSADDFYICTVVTLKFNFRLSGLRRGGASLE